MQLRWVQWNALSYPSCRIAALPWCMLQCRRWRIAAPAAAGQQHSLAVVQVACTMAGAFHLNPSQDEGIVERLPGPPRARPGACAWNARTGGFYVAWDDGRISCLNRSW